MKIRVTSFTIERKGDVLDVYEDVDHSGLVCLSVNGEIFSFKKSDMTSFIDALKSIGETK